MKRLFYIMIALFSLTQLVSCGGDGDKPVILGDEDIVGEWHLTTYAGQAPIDLDAYIVFNSNGTFEIYQQDESLNYDKYSGRYLLDEENVLSGTYTDNSLWRDDYQASVASSGNTLTLTSVNNSADVSVYARQSVPAEIKNSAVIKSQSRSEAQLPAFRLL